LRRRDAVNDSLPQTRFNDFHYSLIHATGVNSCVTSITLGGVGDTTQAKLVAESEEGTRHSTQRVPEGTAKMAQARWRTKM
jgi:hypothetical protein